MSQQGTDVYIAGIHARGYIGFEEGLADAAEILHIALQYTSSNGDSKREGRDPEILHLPFCTL